MKHYILAKYNWSTPFKITIIFVFLIAVVGVGAALFVTAASNGRLMPDDIAKADAASKRESLAAKDNANAVDILLLGLGLNKAMATGGSVESRNGIAIITDATGETKNYRKYLIDVTINGKPVTSTPVALNEGSIYCVSLRHAGDSSYTIMRSGDTEPNKSSPIPCTGE